MTTTPEALRAFLRDNHLSDLSICGSSMAPMYSNGTKVTVISSDKQYLNGRIYAFWQGDKIFAHRLVRVHNGNALMIGDNNPFPEKIPVSSIFAKVKDSESAAFIALRNAINYFFIITLSFAGPKALTVRRAIIRTLNRTLLSCKKRFTKNQRSL